MSDIPPQSLMPAFEHILQDFLLYKNLKFTGVNMRFTFDRDAMIKEVSIAQEIITNKSPISILSNILLIAQNNILTIKASDTSVNFISTIPVEIQEEGTTTIYCDKFMAILSSSPSGEIEFIQEDIKVTIKPLTKRRNFQLKSIASEKFPDFSSSNDLPFFEVPAKELKQMIKQTIFSVSQDPNRYFMTGVYFHKKEEELVMVSTDAKRLSYIQKSMELPDFSGSIVPVKILNCILKNASEEGNISLAIIDKMIFAKFSNYEFSSKLLDGQFPNYQKVIPEHQNFSFTVNKNDLDSALKSVGIMLEKKVNRIIFKIDSENLTIYSPESEIGTADEIIPCRYDGEEVQIALNYNYLIDPIKSISSDELTFEFTEPLKAITLRPEPAEDYFHIIMPMSITN